MRSIIISALFLVLSFGLVQAAEPVDGSSGLGSFTTHASEQPLMMGRSASHRRHAKALKTVRSRDDEHVNPLSGKLVGQPLQPNDLGYTARH